MTKLSNSELFIQMFITASQVVIKNHSFEKFDLTRLQALTLANICRMPGISMGRLANLIGVSRSQITGIVETLVQISLVRREKSPKNRRFYNIYSTEKGDQFFEKQCRVLDDYFEERLQKLNEDELEQLKANLEDSFCLMDKSNMLPQGFINPFTYQFPSKNQQIE